MPSFSAAHRREKRASRGRLWAIEFLKSNPVLADEIAEKVKVTPLVVSKAKKQKERNRDNSAWKESLIRLYEAAVYCYNLAM